MTPAEPSRGWTSGRHSTARGVLLDLGACLAAAVAWSWPLAARLGTGLRDAEDAATQAWVLAWVRHALLSAPLSLFQANAFAPARDALAFSEPLVGYGVVSIPLQLLGLGPAACLNVVCVLFLGLGLFAVARLAMDLGAPRPAALAGALAATFGALTTVQLGFVSFTAFGGIPLAVLAWRRLERERSFGAAARLGLVLGLLGWFSLHLFAFALVPVALLAAASLARAGRAAAPLALRLTAGAALAGVVLVPLAIPLLRVRSAEGFTRDRAETSDYSASPAHWLATTDANPGQRLLPFRSGSERALYPGTVALALSLAALAGLRTPGVRPLAAAGALLVAVGFLGSLGPATPFFSGLAAALPPLFGGIRVAARFAFVSLAGFGLLASAGVVALGAVVRRPVLRRAGYGALLAATAVDVRHTVPFDVRPEKTPAVERFLAAADAGGPILHLPLHHAPPDARFLLSSTAHFKPIVNGTLSYIPQRNLDLAEALGRVPVPPGTWDRVERWPVGTIVVHEHALALPNVPATLGLLDEALRSGRVSGPVRFPHSGGTDWVFGVDAVRGRRPWGVPLPGDPAADLAAFREHASAFPAFDGTEDATLPASVDSPPEGAVVAGDLVVAGWCQTGAGPGEVVETVVDGDRRDPSRSGRSPRPDVAAALPRLGDCGRAGFEVRLPFVPGDEGRHALRVVFRGPGGEFRTLGRTFTWTAPKSPGPPPA